MEFEKGCAIVGGLVGPHDLVIGPTIDNKVTIRLELEEDAVAEFDERVITWGDSEAAFVERA